MEGILRRLNNYVPDGATRALLWMYSNVYSEHVDRGSTVYDLGDFKMRLDISESKMMRQRRFKNFESEISDALHRILNPGDVYVDIGSNKGYHAPTSFRKTPKSGVLSQIQKISKTSKGTSVSIL